MLGFAAVLTSCTAVQEAARKDAAVEEPANTPSGKDLYVVCVACHGEAGEGNLALNAPAIAGMETWYLATALQSFKAGLRGTHDKDVYGQQMRPMAMALADNAAVLQVAAYVNGLSPANLIHAGGGDVQKGKTLYATCAACHGANGKGNPAVRGPNLTLQQDWYVIRQLKNFKEGIRGGNPRDVQGMQMRPMALVLRDEQAMKDVAAYIATLK